jgi:hypothetical protein
MHDDFTQFRTKLWRHIADCFEALRVTANATGEEIARTPYTEEPFPVQCEALFPHFELMVYRALAAREAFRQDAPPWAPELPLSSAEWEKMIRSKSNKIALVGYFGRSLACAGWCIHPAFRDYARGVTACEHTPEHIRTDPALLREFPPGPLGALDRSLCWNTFGRIFDFTQQLMRNEETWRRCGRSDDAKWMRGVLEQLVGIKLDKKLRDFLDSQSVSSAP